MDKNARPIDTPAADPLALFADRDQATGDRVSLVIDRGATKPSPYVSYAEFQRDLAEAYQARAEFWSDVVEWGVQHTSGVLFSALLAARSGAEEAARECRSESRRAEDRAADRAAAVAA